MNNVEQTLSIIKPDAVERNLIDEIKSIFKKIIYKLKMIKKYIFPKEEAAEFYKVHQSKPFYNDLCELSFFRSNSSNDTRRERCSS